MTQYHFLDDSGDPGLEGKSGSSSHFVLAMVQLPQRAALSELGPVRRMFHLPATFEFKYYRTKPRQKIAFFKAVSGVPFRVRAVAVNKAKLEHGLTAESGADLTIRLIIGLADMIAGAVRQYVSSEDTTCYRMFAHKVVDLWQIPGNNQ